jgi:hypothetical protein
MSAEAAPAINPCGVVTVPLAIKSIFSIIDKYIIGRTDEAKKRVNLKIYTRLFPWIILIF